MIESHRRRTAEKRRMYRGPSINRPPLRGFRLSQTKLGLIPSDLTAWVSSLTELWVRMNESVRNTWPKTHDCL